MKEISLNPDYKTMWKVECELNQHLQQQLESITNKCAELNYDKNCLISDLNQSKENERKFKQQLEEKEKLIVALDKTRLRFTETISDLTEQKYEIKQQLEEAVEVIAEFNEYREATDRKETSKSNTKWHTYERILYDKAKRFIAKYRGEK